MTSPATGRDTARACPPPSSSTVPSDSPRKTRQSATRAHTSPDSRTEGELAGALGRIAELHGQLVIAYSELAQKQLAVFAERAVMCMPRNENAALKEMHKPRSLLSAEDVAKQINCDARTVRRWRDGGKLPAAITIGGVVRWRAEDIGAWLDAHIEATP